MLFYLKKDGKPEIHVGILLIFDNKIKLEKFSLKGPEEIGWDMDRDVRLLKDMYPWQKAGAAVLTSGLHSTIFLIPLEGKPVE